MPCIQYVFYGQSYNLPEFSHLTLEIYTHFHTIIWSASVHQHYLSFLAGDFARNTEKETLQKQKSLKGPEGYPNSLSCELLLDTVHYSDLKHSPLRDVTSISCFGKHLCSCTNSMTSRTIAPVLSVDRFHLFHSAQHLGHSLFAAPRQCSEMGRETDRRSEHTLCRSHHLPRPMPRKWPRALSLEGNYLC